jgi:ABC-type proline/glycine betaine transport system permease subunit
MNYLDKSIITLCLTICVLILLVINLTLGINYIKQQTMQNVLRDCRIDAEEQLHIESY